MPKYKGKVCYPILLDEHIQWLVKRLHVDRDIIIESPHRQLNEAIQFPHHVSISFVSKAIQNQVGFTLMLMHYEPNDYTNEERLRKCIEWFQKKLDLSGNMMDVVYMDEVGFTLHLTH